MIDHDRSNQAIEALAVSYAAYSRAMRENDYPSLGVWCRILRDDQIKTGVTLVPAEMLDDVMQAAHVKQTD